MVRKTSHHCGSLPGPTNFKHVSHVGYDPSSGFDLKAIPDDLKKLLKQAGVKKADLHNPEKVPSSPETRRLSLEALLLTLMPCRP